MSPDAHSLDCITIDVPCPASWDMMTGNERVRFCSHCQLHVYNLSAMSRQEAEDHLRQSDGRLCVRLYRRPDGTVLTRDCRTLCDALGRRLVWMALLFVVVPMVTFWWAFSSVVSGKRFDLRRVEPLGTVLNWFDPQPPAPLRSVPLPTLPGTRAPVCDPFEEFQP